MLTKSKRDMNRFTGSLLIVGLALLPLSACSGASGASSEDIKGTIYYDAVLEAWDSLDAGGKSMMCGFNNDDDREALYAAFSISFKFDQDINLNEENTPKYNQAIDVLVGEKC